MACAGISPSTNTNNIEPSPSNEDDEHEHPTNHSHNGNDDESQDVGSRESSEPVVVSPARTPTEEEDEEGDDDDNELFVHAAAAVKDMPPLFQKEEEEALSKTISISISIPPCYKAGLSKKATPLALKSWAALSLTLDGRDKLTKVFQYVTRLLGWWLTGSGFKNGSQRFLNLSKALSTSRKAFRLGRSFVELDKLRSMGLPGLVLWHLQGGDEASPHPKTYVRRASSNIGWGPMTAMSESDQESKQQRPSSLYRSVSSMAYRNMYRPLVSRLSQSWGLSERPTEELWTVIGSAIKLMALGSFWIGDNVNFLTSSGALDDFEISPKERMTKRHQLSTLAGVRANQAYFAGAIAGLLVNWRTYFAFKRDAMQPAEAHLTQQVLLEEDKDRTMKELVKLQEKQFSLFLALLKVCTLRVHV
jgi:hypothetical protein